MKMTRLLKLYEADKRILGFSPHTLKAYSLQFKVLAREIGNLTDGDKSAAMEPIRRCFSFRPTAQLSGRNL